MAIIVARCETLFEYNGISWQRLMVFRMSIHSRSFLCHFKACKTETNVFNRLMTQFNNFIAYLLLLKHLMAICNSRRSARLIEIDITHHSLFIYTQVTYEDGLYYWIELGRHQTHRYNLTLVLCTRRWRNK